MNNDACSIDGCERRATSRGWCGNHYLNWWRTGDPLARYTQPTAVRLERESIHDEASGCWLWPFGVQRNGYGRISISDKRQLAHRASYEAFKGAIPAGLTIDHLCHSADPTCSAGFGCLHRRCVNPEHLEAVTMRENLYRSPNRPEARTHCPQGHPYSGENLIVEKTKYGTARKCRACWRETYRKAGRRYRMKKQEDA